ARAPDRRRTAAPHAAPPRAIMRHGLLAVVVSALAIGCETPAPRPSEAPRDSVVGVLDSARLIRPDGIGHARAGMTIGALRAALPADMTLGDPAPFMVDILAMPVMRASD